MRELFFENVYDFHIILDNEAKLEIWNMLSYISIGVEIMQIAMTVFENL